MRFLIPILMAVFMVACTSTLENGLGYIPQRGFESYQHDEYWKGRDAAKLDLQRGVLGYEDIQCEEEEGWRVLWCFRRLLRERYGIAYRVISPSPLPGPVARIAGYQKVVKPIIEARLGADWKQRIYKEAELFYHKHWSDVEHIYLQERWSVG